MGTLDYAEELQHLQDLQSLARQACAYKNNKLRAGEEPLLPSDSAARKDIPLCRGVLDYFPLALVEVAKVSKVGNDQHNLGEPLHWSREKSSDHEDCIMRHLVERGGLDTDGIRHSVKLAWRALALAQIELEEALGAGKSRGSR